MRWQLDCGGPVGVRVGGCARIATVIPAQLRRIPRSAVTPGVALIDSEGKRVRRARSVLVLAELPVSVSRRLKDRGAELTVVESVRAAIDSLAAQGFDAAIVDTLIANATAMVKAINSPIRFDKELLDQIVNEEISSLGRLTPEQLTQLKLDLERPDSSPEARASTRHALTPVFMIQPGDETYAIIVRPPRAQLP